MAHQIYPTYKAGYNKLLIIAYFVTFLSCSFEIIFPYMLGYVIHSQYLNPTKVSDEKYREILEDNIIILVISLSFSAILFVVSSNMYNKYGIRLAKRLRYDMFHNY